MSDGKKTFEIWMEGYMITGNSSEARFIGTGIGNTFEEAVEHWRDSDPVKNSKDLGKTSSGFWAIWACRLYDNEADARKGFG